MTKAAESDLRGLCVSSVLRLPKNATVAIQVEYRRDTAGPLGAQPIASATPATAVTAPATCTAQRLRDSARPDDPRQMQRNRRGDKAPGEGHRPALPNSPTWAAPWNSPKSATIPMARRRSARSASATATPSATTEARIIGSTAGRVTPASATANRLPSPRQRRPEGRSSRAVPAPPPKARQQPGDHMVQTKQRMTKPRRHRPMRDWIKMRRRRCRSQ